MKLLVLDFETTGVDPKTCVAIELACMLYDAVTRERSAPLTYLLKDGGAPQLTDEIVALTGITTQMLEDEGVSPHKALNGLMLMARKADMFVAYNAPYDRAVLAGLHQEYGMALVPQPWLCAMSDLPWPEKMMACKKLQHRAMDIGLPMDNREQHRALADVVTVCDIFDLYDMPAVIAYAAQPDIFLKAMIPPPWEGKGGDGGVGRDKAKALGFAYERAAGTDGPVFAKSWVKRCKAYEASDFPFEVQVLK